MKVVELGSYVRRCGGGHPTRHWGIDLTSLLGRD